MRSWARVGRVSFLVGSWDGSIRPSGSGGSVKRLRFGDGVEIYQEIVGCVPGSERSKYRGYFPSAEVYLAHMLTISLSDMFGSSGRMRCLLGSD